MLGYDMICSLLCFMGKRGWTIVYFLQPDMRKIPFPIFRFLFLFRFLFRFLMTGFRTLKLHGNKMDFLQTTICEVSGNVSWTGKDGLEPGLGMGRTWQISGRICLPWGKNLSSGYIAKCDPEFSSWKKLWKSRKTWKTPYCLGGAGRFWKTRAKQ